MQAAAAASGRERALAEIHSIKPQRALLYGWSPRVVENDDGTIALFVRFTRRTPKKDDHGNVFLLRLRYESDFETAGRREEFCNPANPDEVGERFWPKGMRGVTATSGRLGLCLVGTWACHSVHHRDRDGRVASLNRLLVEIQKCLNE